MKKKLYILPFILLFVFSSSCDEFLEEETRGVLAPSNFFNNDEEAILAANGIYRYYTFGQLYGHFPFGLIMATRYGADDLGLSRTFSNMPLVEDYTISETNYGQLRSMWTQFYKVINEANVVAENVRGNENLSETIRNQVEGEAIFLRSFAYYHLTNIFGGVPYYTEVLGLSEAASLGRTDASTIRQDILADLTDLENRNLLPSASSGAEISRASIWAAKTLKAKIALWEGDW